MLQSEIENKILTSGYFIAEAQNKDFLNALHKSVSSLIADFEPKFEGHPLDQLHKVIPQDKVNILRMKIFNSLNESKSFRRQYFELGSDIIEMVCGTELAANSKVNFSIQLPGDESSILPSHCDTFSGESSYQINLWVPLTTCFETNSMHIFKPNITEKILNDLEEYEKSGLDKIFDQYEDGTDFVELPLQFGQIVVFTPTTLHGNRLNKTNHTRISLNCRFKNLHSPYNAPPGSSKVLGQFYSPLTEKLATRLGRERDLSRLADQ